MPHFATSVQSISNSNSDSEMMQQISKDIPFFSDPVYRPPSKPIKISMSELPESIDINPVLNIHFKEN